MDDEMSESTASRPPRWVGPFLITFVVALNVVGFLTNASAPELLNRNPLGLMALNPRYRYLVVAAPNVDPLPYYLIGVARLLFSDPVYFALGWFYGDRAIRYFSDAIGEPAVNSTRQFFLRASTVMAMFFAGPIICVLAGAARMRPRKYFVLDLIGTTIIVFALRQFSNALEPFIQSFLDFNAKYARWLMIITITTTLIIVGRVGRRQFGAAKAFRDDVSDDE